MAFRGYRNFLRRVCHSRPLFSLDCFRYPVLPPDGALDQEARELVVCERGLNGFRRIGICGDGPRIGDDRRGVVVDRIGLGPGAIGQD